MGATVIQHAHEIGDKVWTLVKRQDPVRKTCVPCGGTKVIRILVPGETRQRRRKCPYCYGKGTVSDGPQETEEVKGPAAITRLYVSREIEIDEKTGERSVETRVSYRGNGWPFRSMQPEDVFATKTAASQEAKRRNAARNAPPTPEVG